MAGQGGELVFRGCGFGAGAAGITVQAAGEGTVGLSLGDGPVLAVLTLSPGTGGPYDYATVSAPVVLAAGVHDVRLGLRGPVRLARVAFSA
ncbi:carbohydrate-binding protein [Streptomyces sp. NPDC052023]|uniref:carbohydrate-binding protein n=1 Tax=Streptomyces sp. NPDC052023 TaxID=3365681 RepID=UPI0037CF9F14